MDAEETRAFFKKDSGIELAVGDKIYVTQGELQQAFGTIVNFDDGGQTVSFKPQNIEGFEDNVQLDRGLVVKYFEQGDPVRVIEGKFQYETGLVMSVDENDVTMPMVKMDSTQREVRVNTNFLKLKNDRDKDDITLVNKRRKINQPGAFNIASLTGGEK